MTPQTPTGKRLVNGHVITPRTAIAIEREAAVAERERLRAAHTPTVDRDGDPACTCGWEAYPNHFDVWWDHVDEMRDALEDDR